MEAATTTCTKCGKDKSFSEFSMKLGKRRSRCKSCESDYRTANYDPKRERERGIEKHGITIEKYLELLSAQRGGCAICGRVPEKIYDLYVDHDHKCCSGAFSCGECVRGLLCQKCNTGIGMFNDDYKVMEYAVMYLTGGIDGW